MTLTEALVVEAEAIAAWEAGVRDLKRLANAADLAMAQRKLIQLQEGGADEARIADAQRQIARIAERRAA